MIRPEQRKLFAVIGNPVQHSLSPVMMSACFAALGLPALYAAFYVDELERDLEVLHAAGFSGLSVTLPYKEVVCRLAEPVDVTAKEIGAANTLRRQAWLGGLQHGLDGGFASPFGSLGSPGSKRPYPRGRRGGPCRGLRS